MVSFWPFKGEDNSAASFEKTLSQLSQKITKASARNESFRQQQRRYKVLWTLYSSFAYILIALILTLGSCDTATGSICDFIILHIPGHPGRNVFRDYRYQRSTFRRSFFIPIKAGEYK